MNAATDPVIADLNAATRLEPAASYVADVLRRVTAQLETTDGPMAWEPIPLSVFGDTLPDAVRSCWVFVIRPGAETGPERHPNSHQRSFSLTGAGAFEVHEHGRWARHPLMSEAPNERWVSIPPNTWHRLSVGGEPWGLLSFHTVEARALVEEVPVDPEDLAGATEQHLYEDR